VPNRTFALFSQSDVLVTVNVKKAKANTARKQSAIFAHILPRRLIMEHFNSDLQKSIVFLVRKVYRSKITLGFGTHTLNHPLCLFPCSRLLQLLDHQ
jgi:hypothetical protein